MENEDEDFNEETHDDNYLDRLGIVIIEPKKPVRKGTLNRDLPDWPAPGYIRENNRARRNGYVVGNNNELTTTGDRYGRRTAPFDYPNAENPFGERQSDGTINQDIPIHHRMNIHPELQNYLNRLPHVILNLEHRIEVRREVVREDDQNVSLMDSLSAPESQRDVQYTQREVYVVGDNTFLTVHEARDYCREQRGYDPGENVFRSQEGAEKLIGESLDMLLGFLHSTNGRRTIRGTSPTSVINDMMEVCKRNKLIDAFSIQQNMESFGYTLRLKKWEYHLHYNIDTGMLNF